MQIKLFKVIDTLSPLPPSGDLVVIRDKKEKKYHLSEAWLDRFQALMEESEHKGTFGEPKTSFQHHYLGHSYFRALIGKKKEVEALYRKFRETLIVKRIFEIVIVFGVLVELALIIF
jgi:hypothetical protein